MLTAKNVFRSPGAPYRTAYFPLLKRPLIRYGGRDLSDTSDMNLILALTLLGAAGAVGSCATVGKISAVTTARARKRSVSIVAALPVPFLPKESHCVLQSASLAKPGCDWDHLVNLSTAVGSYERAAMPIFTQASRFPTSLPPSSSDNFWRASSSLMRLRRPSISDLRSCASPDNGAVAFTGAGATTGFGAGAKRSPSSANARLIPSASGGQLGANHNCSGRRERGSNFVPAGNNFSATCTVA